MSFVDFGISVAFIVTSAFGFLSKSAKTLTFALELVYWTLLIWTMLFSLCKILLLQNLLALCVQFLFGTQRCKVMSHKSEISFHSVCNNRSRRDDDKLQQIQMSKYLGFLITCDGRREEYLRSSCHQNCCSKLKEYFAHNFCQQYNFCQHSFEDLFQKNADVHRHNTM